MRFSFDLIFLWNAVQIKNFSTSSIMIHFSEILLCLCCYPVAVRPHEEFSLSSEVTFCLHVCLYSAVANVMSSNFDMTADEVQFGSLIRLKVYSFATTSTFSHSPSEKMQYRSFFPPSSGKVALASLSPRSRHSPYSGCKLLPLPCVMAK